MSWMFGSRDAVQAGVPAGTGRPFVAIVPLVPGAKRHRASVTSFRSAGMQAA